MKIICVTGAPGSDVDKVADIFFAAGVKPALPLRQDPSFTLSGWHEKVIAAAGGDKMPAGAVKQPGRFWEQFATNLFMENMQQPLWAWGDTRSVWLLDFWQQFEPNLHFVLVYTSPQRALAEALAAEREHGADTAALMAAWEAHQKEILRFHHRNPERTILVDAAECGAAPGALIDACAARWHLELGLSAAPRTVLPAPAPLVGYLAEQLRLTHPELQALQQELESSLYALHPEQTARLPGPDLFAAVDDYREVRSAAARTDVLGREVDALSGQLTVMADTARKLADEKSGVESTISELKQKIAELEAEVTNVKSDNIEARGENDQILLQMHRLQEELERNVIENRQLDEANSASRRTIDELNKKVAQSEESVGTLKKELDTAKANKTAEKEKTEALAALATAKTELEAARQGVKQLEIERHSAMETRQENELLLVQLHQVQEELERHFLEHKNAVKRNAESVATLQKDLDATKANKAATEKEKTDALAALATAKRTTDDLSKKLVQFETSVGTLKKELDVVKANKAVKEKEKTDALAALATAKRTTDDLSKKATQFEMSVGTLKKELAEAKANKVAEKEKAEALAALATVRKELEAARQSAQRLETEQRNAREAQQESELLLVQLHQVQEELEHYFFEHKNAVKQNGELASQWQRMLERNPEYCDYRSLELVNIDLPGQRTSWRFTDLNAAGQAYAELRFDAIIAGEVAAIAFADQGEGEVSAMPNAMDTLTTAQWMLLPKLCNILNDALQAPVGSVARLDETQRSALRTALDGLRESIDALPPTMRFDRITLKREQVNSDYEHLWLQLGNLSVGDRRWGDVDFRLSCANVRPGKFGAHPKLEFPSETGAALLEGWFAESFDDFGDKLELRFALPEAMDMSVWEKLSQADQTILKILVANLPLMLSRLADGQVRLSRPFTDWQQLAGAVESILAARTVVAMPTLAPTAVPDVPLSRHAGEAHEMDMVRKGFI